jgi:hypothetical protein
MPAEGSNVFEEGKPAAYNGLLCGSDHSLHGLIPSASGVGTGQGRKHDGSFSGMRSNCNT